MLLKGQALGLPGGRKEETPLASSLLILPEGRILSLVLLIKSRSPIPLSPCLASHAVVRITLDWELYGNFAVPEKCFSLGIVKLRKGWGVQHRQMMLKVVRMFWLLHSVLFQQKWKKEYLCSFRMSEIGHGQSVYTGIFLADCSRSSHGPELQAPSFHPHPLFCIPFSNCNTGTDLWV